MKIATSLLLSALGAAVLIANAQAGAPIDETRAVGADTVISVDLLNGELTVVGSDRAEFHISGELSDDAVGYRLVDRDNGLHFEEEREARVCTGIGRDCGAGEGARLTLEVPRNGILRVEGTNLDVDVRDLERNTEIKLINGAIAATNLKGVVKLNTVNGEIRSRGLDGRISLETVNGSIDDRDSSGTLIEYQTVNGDIESNTRAERIRLDNVNGEIELMLSNIDELQASTVGGEMEIIATLNTLAQVELSSVNGDIELAVPTTTSANFVISTSVGGRIENELSSDKPVRRDRFVNSSDLNFTLNGGTAQVRINTVSGDITLCAPDADQEPGC